MKMSPVPRVYYGTVRRERGRLYRAFAFMAKNTFPHLIDLDSYPVSAWNSITALGLDIKRNPHIYVGACNGKIMGTLFYEPIKLL